MAGIPASTALVQDGKQPAPTGPNLGLRDPRTGRGRERMMSEPKSIGMFKMWVVAWPRKIDKEFKPSIKPLLPVSCEIADDVRVPVKIGRKRRHISIDAAAIFSTKKEAVAWQRSQGYEKCFPVKRCMVQVLQ